MILHVASCHVNTSNGSFDYIYCAVLWTFINSAPFSPFPYDIIRTLITKREIIQRHFFVA